MKFYYFNLFVGVFIALQIAVGAFSNVSSALLLSILCGLNLFIAYTGFMRDKEANQKQEKKYKDFKDPKDYF